MHFQYSLEKVAVVTVVVVSLGLAGCAGNGEADADSPSNNTTIGTGPDESALSAKAEAYETAEDLRMAFEDSGYECSEWSEMDFEGADDAGTCSDGKDQFLIFEDDGALTSHRESVSNADGADPDRHLFGPNWSAYASKDALQVVRNHIGGQLGW